MDIGLILFRTAVVLATLIFAGRVVLDLVAAIRAMARPRDDIQAPVAASMRRWSYLADRRG